MNGDVILDHIGLSVTDFAKSRAFYIAALAPLGITLVMEGDNFAMAGQGERGAFWFDSMSKPTSAIHVAFAAGTRADVDAFYKAAIKAGGVDNGAPGLRPQYHKNYYGAFVLDPDGHNIEAVCHKPE